MSLTIELSAAAQRILSARAAKDGKTVEAVASELLEQAVAPEETFDEILAPFRQEFAESGMTEAEWDAMIEQARQEVWDEKHGKRP